MSGGRTQCVPTLALRKISIFIFHQNPVRMSRWRPLRFRFADYQFGKIAFLFFLQFGVVLGLGVMELMIP